MSFTQYDFNLFHRQGDRDPRKQSWNVTESKFESRYYQSYFITKPLQARMLSDFLKAIQLLNRNPEVLCFQHGSHHWALNKWGSEDKGPGFLSGEEDRGLNEDQPLISAISFLKQSDSGGVSQSWGVSGFLMSEMGILWAWSEMAFLKVQSSVALHPSQTWSAVIPNSYCWWNQKLPWHHGGKKSRWE